MTHRPQLVGEIDVSIDEPFQARLSEEWLRMVMAAGLSEALPGGGPAQVGLVITGDETVQDLNRRFRGLDEVTDVLSFSVEHSGHWGGEDEENGFPLQDPADTAMPGFILPSEEPSPLGEVIISFPQTQRQAAERNIPLGCELALLIVHGVLHLVGYDHLETEDMERMQSKERAALASVTHFTPSSGVNEARVQ
jgi:probable rRNA maturation factor